MSFLFCLSLLALSSVAAASDPGCEELVKPLEDQSKVAGKWIYHVGTSNSEELLNELKTINSSWIELSPIPDSDNMSLRWGDKDRDGNCLIGNVNATFSGNFTKVTFHFKADDHEHIGKYLVTCPDCILWADTSMIKGEARKGRNLYLFTKSGRLDDSDLEVFRKQAACLNFSPELHFGGNENLCPDEEAVTDVKQEEQ